MAKKSKKTDQPAWRVTGPGLPPTEVHAADEAGALEAFMAEHGAWTLGSKPAVERVGQETPADQT